MNSDFAAGVALLRCDKALCLGVAGLRLGEPEGGGGGGGGGGFLALCPYCDEAALAAA